MANRRVLMKVVLLVLLLVVAATLVVIPPASAQDEPTVSIIGTNGKASKRAQKQLAQNTARLDVRGENAEPDAQYSLWQCAPDQTGSDCTKVLPNPWAKGIVEEDGTFSENRQEFHREMVQRRQQIDCAQVSCFIEYRSGSARARTALPFTSTSPLPLLTIEAAAVAPGQQTVLTNKSNGKHAVQQCPSNVKAIPSYSRSYRCVNVGNTVSGTGTFVAFRLLDTGKKVVDCAKPGRCELRVGNFITGAPLLLTAQDPLPRLSFSASLPDGDLPQFSVAEVKVYTYFTGAQIQQCIKTPTERRCQGLGTVGEKQRSLDRDGPRTITAQIPIRRHVWSNGEPFDCAAPNNKCFLKTRGIGKRAILRFDATTEPSLPELIVPEGPFKVGDEIRVELRNAGPLTSGGFRIVANPPKNSNHQRRGNRSIFAGADGATGSIFVTIPLTQNKSCGGPDKPCYVWAETSPGTKSFLAPIIVLD